MGRGKVSVAILVRATAVATAVALAVVVTGTVVKGAAATSIGGHLMARLPRFLKKAIRASHDSAIVRRCVLL